MKEEDIEQWAIELFQNLGYHYLCGPDIAPDSEYPERKGYNDVVLQNRLEQIVNRLNPQVPSDARLDAIRRVVSLPTPNLVPNNKIFHEYFVNGIDVEYSINGETKGDKVWLVDFENVENNEFLVVNQFTVIENYKKKRPDIILFVNGLPLVVLELKNPTSANATVRNAFDQLQTYKNTIPSLFYYNGILAASDGFEARTGSLTAGFSRFLRWKSVDGITDASKVVNQLEILIKGLLNKETLLDIIQNFTVFQEERKEDPKTGSASIDITKKVAAYHQYYAVNKAVITSKKAASVEGDRRCGVIWHTQGSGKSLSMVFYSGKLIKELDNPTIVLLTDRNDLDEQLFETFSGCQNLLRQAPVQASSREHLQNLLSMVSGGVVFTTVQKFFPSQKGEQYPMLSDRKNIVVIADEAHRSQYDFIDGFARHMRDALPNASFIGFTGTPIEGADKNTRSVFGDYIDVYDIQQAVEDGATVPIYYESRLVKVGIKDDNKEELDNAFDIVAEEATPYGTEDLKRKWARLEAIVGSEERLKDVAKDFINHFENRQAAQDGKAMFVAMSRKIAVRLYDKIIELRPEWHSNDINKGVIKVIMSGSSSDEAIIQNHLKSKVERNFIANRIKDPSDSLKIVIVRDMWLTGFDAPSMHTLYVDKPMGGHNLMQAIARVNRVFGDKPGGLVVDYIGIAHDLKKALSLYTESGGKGKPAFNQNEAVAVMLEKFEVVHQLLYGFNYKPYFNASVSEKMNIIRTAQEFILEQDDGKKRFIEQVNILSKSFALSVPHKKALEIKDQVGFFQEVRSVFKKFSVGDSSQTEEVETAIRQIISGAVVSEGVVDVFDAAGIKKPDLSILSNEFLAEIQGMSHKNVAFELLKKIIRDEIKAYSETNVVASKSFADRLEEMIKRYQNKVISTAQIIEELIALAKDMREAEKRGEELNMSNDELAFYDALEVNDSAVKVLGDDLLRDIARELVEKVRRNVSIDWTIKSSVRAKLRVLVKRTLRKYGYPPDMQLKAIETVLEQAEKLTGYWLEK